VRNRWGLVQTTGEAPCPRGYHGAVVLKNEMVVFGGFDGDFLLNDLFALNLGLSSHIIHLLHSSLPYIFS
jgi:hypothetical protein